MACRYTYQGKTYEAFEFDDVLKAMKPTEASKYMTGVQSIPDAPMIGKTEAWVSLALKRTIKYAVDNGFDRIAMVNGEQSAERYDLSKQVDRIQYEKTAEDKYTINVVGKDGQKVVEEKGVPLSRVEDLAGKEIAKKIAQNDGEPGEGKYSNWRTLSGLDLKVGGEGMKAFYDKIVPNVANDVLKKLGGGKVSETSIIVDKENWKIRPPSQTVSGRWMVRNDDYTSKGLQFDTEAEAQAVLATKQKSKKHNSFDITDKMKEQAAQGMPLFKRDQPQPKPEQSAVAKTIRPFTLERGLEMADLLQKAGVNEIKVVSSVRMMPETERKAVLARAPDGQIRGAYFRETNGVWIVTNNIRTPDEFVFTVLHEGFHRGLANTIGGRAKVLLRGMYETNANLRAETKAQMDRHGIGQDEAIEEALADMAGMGEARDLKGWDKLVELIRSWLGKLANAVGVKITWTDDMIADFVAGVRRNGLVDGVHLIEAKPDTITIDGKERSRLNSNGKPIAATDEELRNFYAWFGDSKVVDEQGRPVVVYHGTDKTFNKINMRKGAQGLFWFTSDKAAIEAGEVGAQGSGKIMEMYAKIESPADWKQYEQLLIMEFKGRGLDGAMLPDDDGTFTGFALRPDQIKSADKNNGEFSPDNADIRFSRTGAGKSPPAPPSQTSLPLQGNNQQWLKPEPSKIDTVRYTLQDKHIDTKRVVVAIKNARQQLVDTWNPYLKEEMFHGRSAKRTANFLKVELVPLLESLQKAGVPIEDFEKFLHARHAEERNVRIAAINPDMPDAGSGMATADARAYLSSVANKPQLEALAKRVDAITQKTRETLRDYGLVSNAEIQAWNTMYPNYVPLMRDDDGGRGTGQGFSIKGAETKRAMGSTKAVTNILANVAMQRERAIVRGEKNRVAIALYGLAKLNPNKDFWETDTPPMMRFIGKDGLVDSMVDPNYKNLDNVVVAKVYHTGTDKVTEHAVVFNEDDERAARMALALKNLDINQLGEVLGTVAKATRYLAAINTQYNPIFGVVNLVRDVQGAAFNLTSTPLANKKAAVLKEIPAALRAVYRAERDKPAQSKYAALWDEFQSVGGPTGYRDLYASPQDRADAIKSEIAKMTEGKVKAAGRAVFDWLSDYNQAMENSVRLAAYKVALDDGMTKEQAASLAKNLTVNFNRKGQIGQQAGSLYAFFNASVQGTARLAETLSGPAGKKIIAGGLLLGVIQALALMGNDDDDPPQFTREKNLIIPLGFKKYVAIPMPLGLHIIPNTSRILTEMFLHGEPLKRTGQLLSGLVDAFSPTGSVGMSVQTVLPTVIDPLAALSENRDWMGRKIYREDFSSLSPTPGHTRTKDTASWVSKQLSVFMNWATGGTEFVKGGLSPTADQIDFLVGQVTGGTGREVIKAEQSVMSLFTGDDLPTYKIPLVGRFYGEIDSPASAAGKFYRNLTKQNEHEATIKGLYKSERDASDYMRDNPDSNLFAAGDAYQRAIAKLQERKREEKKRNEPRETTRATEKEIEGLMRDFNQMVDEAKKTK